MAGGAQPLRSGVRTGVPGRLRLPAGGLISLYGSGLRTLSICTAAAIAAAMGLIFFYAPLDADQGFVQKIFYVHVPMAIVALVAFVAGGVLAIAHLRSGERKWDLRSYVTIHVAVIFGIGVLVTGSIWARASWGHWWVWDEPMLVSFLIVFLLYVVYYPLRFSIEDPERQARFSSVFAIVAGAFVPVNFVAVRLAEAYTHPRVLSQTGGNLPGDMRLTFLVSILAVALLFLTFVKLELTAKRSREQLRRLRRRLEQLAEPAGAAPPPTSSVPARPTVE